MAQGYEDQPLHREGFKAAIASLQRRKDRLARREQELQRRDEKVLVFGEPEAKPMGYGRAPATVIAKHARWLRDQHHLLRALDELRGRDLLCFCAPVACHRDLLLRLANATREERIAWWRSTV